MRRLIVAIAAAIAAALILAVAIAGAESPIVTVENASSVSYTSATAKGTVDPKGKETYCHFEYVSQGQLEQNLSNGGGEFDNAGGADCSGNPHNGTGAQNVEANLTGLTPGTVYHLRLVASNEDGQSAAVAASTFETDPVGKPTVTIDPVTTFTGTTAHFSGQINPNAPGSDPFFHVNWHFECSPGCPGAEGPALGAGSIPQPVEANATGLEPNTDYTVKLIAESPGGTESAGPVSFKTQATGPTAQTFPAFALGSGSEALVGGKVNPKNSATEYWIEYGAGSGATYPSSIPVAKNASAGSGGQAVFLTQKITDLDPASQYHLRLVAKNASGESKGEDVRFETSPTPEPIQGNCPNAKLRTETNSAALPECRAYEMTTEPDKNATDVQNGLAISADGNRVGYDAFGSGFGDIQAVSGVNTYVAQRGASGWTTQSLMPQVSPVPSVGTGGLYEMMDLSADLSVGIITVIRATTEEFGVFNTLLLKPGGSSIRVTAPTVPGAQIFNKNYIGRSADASHIFFESPQEFVPGKGNGEIQIWEWFDGHVRLVSAQEDGSPFPGGVRVGTGVNEGTNPGFSGRFTEPTVVSVDGSRVFFGVKSKVLCYGPYCGVYVREDGQDTRALSVSQRPGSIGEFDGNSGFAGAAVDGSRVYMQSNTQLTNDATPDGGLYSYNLETDEMHFIGAGDSENGLHVVLISEDGTRAYFTSPKVLIPGQGSEGASNLYTANEEGGELTYIGTVGDLGKGALGNVKATSDGGKFAFDSSARLTAYDNAGHREVYLYDAGEGSLRCVSCRPDGQAAGGDAKIGLNEGAHGHPPRVLNSDGASVFFTSSDGLVPGDANGVNDAYQYRAGQVSLISTGTSASPSEIVDNSPDGKNVFFMTRDRLVSQDIDGNKDIYDARVDGGFPPPPPPTSLCEGEACQGQAHGAPPYASPGTASLVGRGNTDGRTKKRTHRSCGRKAKKQHSKCAKKTKKHKSKNKQAKQAAKSGRGE